MSNNLYSPRERRRLDEKRKIFLNNLIKGRNEQERLNAPVDPCWNIEGTTGYEAHYDDLLGGMAQEHRDQPCEAIEAAVSEVLAEMEPGIVRRVAEVLRQNEGRG